MSIARRYYEAVTDAFVPIAWRRRNEAERRFDLVRRARLVVALSGIAGLLVSIMFLIGLARGGADASLLVTLASGLYYLAIPAVVRRSETATVAAVLFIVPVFVIFPLRAVGLGGIESSIVYWYTLVPVGAGLLLSRRGAVLATALALVQVAGLCAFSIVQAEDGALGPLVARGASTAFVLLLLLAMTIFFEAERERREATIADQAARLKGATQLAAVGRAAGGVAGELREPAEQVLDIAALLREPEAADERERERLASELETAAGRIANTVEELGAFRVDE